MDEIEYDSSSNKWVGRFECPNCNRIVLAWQSSGMSMSYPHFYCDKCSNVICRKSDQNLLKIKNNDEILDRIVSTLPNCQCGGQFKEGENPKCPNCTFVFEHGGDPVYRLTYPFLILIDGAVLYDENGPQYKVKIT